MTRTAIITYGEWEERYGPQVNKHFDNASYDGRMYRTAGAELEHVKAVHATMPNHIWTVVDIDGQAWIMPGWQHVNREGYIVCDRPFTDDNLEVCDDPEAYFKELRREGGLRRAQQTMEFSAGMLAELAQWRNAARASRAATAKP